MTRRPDSVRSAARGISAGVNSRGTRGTQSSTLGVAVLSRLDSGSPSPRSAWFSPIRRRSPRCRVVLLGATIGPSLPEDRSFAITCFSTGSCATQPGRRGFVARQSPDNDDVTCVAAVAGHVAGFRLSPGHSVEPLPYGLSCSPTREQNMEQMEGAHPESRSGRLPRRHLELGHGCSVMARTDTPLIQCRLNQDRDLALREGSPQKAMECYVSGNSCQPFHDPDCWGIMRGPG
jgi:hypothetical protein